ncbi:hypothetical protein M501DRAFT_932834 [Patellaria atrata CBS 101060]|uniref:Uncharacterized protein n=1 Tax=Patellaria atrata CBS 101060 TaxID=1346257 RepID=A0A9P4SDN4_9PEZI|nr:hypothetical protein M501DRAFT_932834 [Patellaria atrata CBS 101060]
MATPAVPLNFANASNIIIHVLHQEFGDFVGQILSYARDNPFKTIFHIVNGILFFIPGLFIGPLLSLFGFGAMGIRAASIASVAQTASTPARGLFAILQSAAMGGYGAASVNTVGTVAAGAVGVIVAWFGR